MPFATAKEHRDFYHKNQWIEFEGLLTEAQCHQIAEAAQTRGAGRDLWRHHPSIKKIVCSRDLAQIASELTDAHEIRLAFDQLLDAIPKVTATLSEISCVQGLIGGFILCIKKAAEDAEPTSSFFPHHIGEGVFFSADAPIPFEDIATAQKGSYLMIGYASKGAVYIHQPKDPYLHAWREIDYNFGDRLQNTTHPMIYP